MINRLRAHRFLAGKSQDGLAVEVGVSQAKISRIENGYIRPRSMEKQRIAKALGAKQEELFPDN